MTDHMKGTAMAPRTAPLSAWAAQATPKTSEKGYARSRKENPMTGCETCSFVGPPYSKSHGELLELHRAIHQLAECFERTYRFDFRRWLGQ